MDANQRKAYKARIKRTLENLEKNNFKAVYVNTKDEALTLVKTLIPEGAVTAAGGSVTLRDTGILDYIKSSTDFREDYIAAYSADFYLSSANAVTEHGEIYQVDGRSNRISAILYGPEKVIIVAGINKLVMNVRDAVVRVKTQAAPPNAIKLSKDTPCAKRGVCVSPDCSDLHLTALGCDCDDRICCNSLIMAKQRFKDRIIVILVGEECGY